MITILISFFNSFFFLALFLVIFRSWAVAGIVAGVVWLVTFLALCLSSMAHKSSDVFSASEYPLQAFQDSFQYVSHGARSRDYSLAAAEKKNKQKITGRKESAYLKSN